MPLRVCSLALVAVLAGPSAWGYPEFQRYVRTTSGKSTNCAMCHVHPDGPEGLKPGQIGSLTQDEMSALGQARAAFEPGGTVQSPILNAFGNEIIHRIGKTRFLQIRLDPAKLPEAIGRESDLDDDGICDADEFAAGTHPLDEGSGDPWTLFRVNLRRNAFHLIMMVAATASGIYGLNALLRWFDLLLRTTKRAKDTATTHANKR